MGRGGAGVGQVGAGLAAAERGAEGGVGGGRGGEPGRVAAGGEVWMGSRGDPAPCRADLVVGQIRHGGEPEDGKRIVTSHMQYVIRARWGALSGVERV